MRTTVQYDPRRDAWYFGGQARSSDGAYLIVIKHEDLDNVTGTDLAKALIKARAHDLEPEAIAIDLAPEDQYDPKNAVVDGIFFVLLADGRLGIRFPLTSDRYYDDSDELTASTGQLLGPLLRRTNACLAAVTVDPSRAAAPFYHEGVLRPSTRGKSLGDLYLLAGSALELCNAASAGDLSRATVADLVLGGHAQLLVGQPEGPWLDVKSAHYDLKSPVGKISLAQAVSRFCNSESGGVIVVGMDTKRHPGGETIRSIKPVPIDLATKRRYRQALEDRLFPFPEGLTIETVESEPGEGLVVLSMPPQGEELKPFLVHGAIVEDRTEGAFISIVRRSGEDSIPITAQQIHSTLAAGRALLRRGEIPNV